MILPEIEAIQKAFAEHVEMENRRGPQEPHPYIYASSRRECRRRMYYECTQPEAFPQFDTETKARFTRGNQRERDISIDLKRVGRLCIPKFEFIGEQERIGIMDRKGRKVISGKIDGFLRWESGAHWPAELKSWSVFLTDRIFQFSDLFNNKWTKAGAYQLLAYLYEKNAPYGVLVLDRPGLPRLIQVSLEKNMEAMERFLQDGEIVVDAIEAKEPPPFIEDPEECRRCPIFGSVCNPPMSFDGADIVTDEEAIARFERELELKPIASEFKDIHEGNVEYLRARSEKGKERQFIIGKMLATVKWGKNTTLDMPDDLKKQFQKTDPSGKIATKLVRVTD